MNRITLQLKNITKNLYVLEINKYQAGTSEQQQNERTFSNPVIERLSKSAYYKVDKSIKPWLAIVDAINDTLIQIVISV